jgi:hypothetical protein
MLTSLLLLFLPEIALSTDKLTSTAAWTVDLNSIRDVEYPGPADLDTRSSVTFIDNKQIAVGVVVNLRVNGRWPEIDQQKLCVLLFTIDADTGKILHRRVWSDFQGRPATERGLAMRPVNSHELLVIVGDELLRLSSNLGTLSRRPLAPESEGRNGQMHYDNWDIVTSPKGDSAVLLHRNVEVSGNFHRISTKDLTDETVVTPGPGYVSSGPAFVNETILFNQWQPNVHSGNTFRSMRTGETEPLCLKYPRTRVLGAFGNGLVVLGLRPAASFAIVDLRCNVLYKKHHGHGSDSIDYVSTSSEINRFAFTYGGLRSSLIKGWHETNHIVVVDADARGELLNIGVSDYGAAIGGWHVLVGGALKPALSPDGRSLAVLRGSILQLVTIPHK